MRCDEYFPDGGCEECDLTGCTVCKNPADNVHGNGLCASCGNGFVFHEESKSCVQCNVLYGMCEECDKNGCTVCQNPVAVMRDGECKACSDAYYSGCTECNATSCTRCSGEECCGRGEKIIYVNGRTKCGSCKDFDEACSECTSTECVSCEGNLIMNPMTKKCTPCKELFDGCGKCSTDVCEACTDSSWNLTQNGCYDSKSSIYTPLTQDSHELVSEEAKKKSIAIMTIIIGCLAFIAVACMIAYFIVKTVAKRKPLQVDFEDNVFGEEVELQIM